VTRRVLHVLWSLGHGGAERAVYQLVRAQREAGVDAGMLAVSTPGVYGERLRDEGAPVYALSQRNGLEIAPWRRARALFTRWPVVHFHGCEPALMTAAATSGARVFYTHRAGRFAYRGRQRARYRVAAPVLRARFAGLAANTRHAAGVAAELFGVPEQDVATIYNGIDWALLEPRRAVGAVRAELGLSPAALVVGTSGNLRTWKRIDLAVDAVARASARLELVIVGDGPERPALERLAAERGVTDRVRFAGAQPHVADYLQVCDAFVLPSGPEESFGNAAVEALGSELPTIVMRDGGGLLEHIADGETGLVASDVDHLAACLDLLAGDGELRRALGRRARERARGTYTTAAMVAGHERLYARPFLVETRPTRRDDLSCAGSPSR
jgi:glycosyltransferase involved in cell wall biosynthesis